MSITEKYLSVDSSVLHYIKTGHGPKKLLLFHGFGQDNTVFKHLAAELSSTYTLYIFDLFFHGKSTWGHGERPLEKTHWKKMVSVFLQDNGIEKFSLAGFSLGGKFVLATLEYCPEKIEKIFLIAPDGIKITFWYKIATYPLLFRFIFKSMGLHPKLFFTLVKIAHTLKLADKSVLRFAEHQMNTTAKRQQVYYTWVVFRRFVFNIKEIAQLINNQNISVTFILGVYDKVITENNLTRLSSRLQNCRVERVQTGHNGLLEVKNSLKFFTLIG